MRENKSEIFEAYAKLAEEKEKSDGKELKKYKSDSAPRAGSDSIDTISALYGVKPEAIKNLEYKYNIVEVAHPNAVVVSPSYDKLNGLVENINERQNIIINKIRSRAPSGSVFLLKDAEKDLTMELIRIGNDMDNADQDELRLLADECLEDLKKTAGLWDDVAEYAHKAVNYLGGASGEKALVDAKGVGEGVAAGAGAGALIGAVVTSWGGPLSLAGAGIGGLLGGIGGGIFAYIFNTTPKVKNVKENAKDLLNQMADIKKAVPEEAEYFTIVEDFMEKLVRASDNYIWVLNIVQQKTIKNEPVLPNETKAVEDDVKIFTDMIETFEKIRATFQSKVNTGVFSKALNSVPHPGAANDIEDVTQSFAALATAIEALKSSMKSAVNKTVAVAETKKDEPKKEEVKAPEAKKENSGSTLGKVFDYIGHKPSDEEMKWINSLPTF